MEIEAGVRRLLLDDPAVSGYVGTKVWKYRLEDALDGSGGRAIVVSRVGGWTSPNELNTQEFPKLRVELWADQSRNEDGTISVNDGESSAFAMFRVVDPLLHGVRDVRWGDLFVVGCSRYSEPFVDKSSDFEAVRISVDYAVQVIH